MRKLILAALLAGGAAAPAFAQEESPFTGIRVEGIVGYDSLRSGERDDGVDTSDDEGDESIEGALYGVGAGFDFDLGGVVAGIEGEFSQSGAEQDFDESVDAPFTTRVDVGRDLYIGGRLGFRVAPTTLLYGKAGYTTTRVEAELANDTDLEQFDTRIDGWRFGAGLEQVFGRNMFGKVEYRYSNYGDIRLDEGGEFETDIDLDRHQVVAGIGLRF